MLARHNECMQRPDRSWTCWPESAEGAIAAPQASIDRDMELLKVTSEHFRHDLVALWNHSSYFLIIQGAFASFFANAVGPQESGQEVVVFTARQEGLIFAAVGLVFALIWSLVAYRRVVLIQEWRNNVTHLDGCVDRHGVYLTVEPKVGDKWWYGPSALTARLPWVISAMWFLAIIVLCWAPVMRLGD